MAEFVTVMKERARMCKDANKDSRCTNCGLARIKNRSNLTCYVYIERFPEEAEKIIMDWAAEHPVETMKDRFFKMFPNAPKNYDNNISPRCCPYHLGWEEIGRCNDFKTCLQCWNRPYEEKEAEKGENNKCKTTWI